MSLSEAPIVALLLIHSFEDEAFSVATKRADEACEEGKFSTAYEWRHIAEIIRDETETDLVSDRAAAQPQATTHHRKHWIKSFVRWIEMHFFLSQPIAWGWDPFGPDLEPWKAMGLAEDGNMVLTSAGTDGYRHLLDDVGLPSTLCASCAGHLVCAEVRHTLTNRAQRLRLEERLAHRAHHHHNLPEVTQPVDKIPTESVADDRTTPHEDTPGAGKKHVLSPLEADIREALIKCWMRKSGLMHERIQAKRQDGAATP